MNSQNNKDTITSMSFLLIVLAALGSGTSAEGADSLLALAEFEESEAMYTAADSLYLLAFSEPISGLNS